MEHLPVDTVVPINAFVVPADRHHEYILKYRCVMDELHKQPGFLGGSLHRAIDPATARFQFVNVNHWVSKDAFEAGIKTVAPEKVFGDLNAAIEANPALFSVEVSYPPSGR